MIEANPPASSKLKLVHTLDSRAQLFRFAPALPDNFRLFANARALYPR
jgi:hypothetical protein